MPTNSGTLLADTDYRPRPPPRTDFGIGIIGAGGIANGAHIPAYMNAGFRVVGAADVREEAIEATCQRWSIEHGFSDYRRLLALPEVDIVDVAIGPEGRVEIVRAAAAAGKHVLIQKPFAHTYAEALAMVEAAERAVVKLAVNQNARWSPSYRAAGALLAKGVIGEPFLIVHELHGNQDTTLSDHAWYPTVDDFLLIQWANHNLDLVRFWTGLEPHSVYCTATKMLGQHFRTEMAVCHLLEFEGRLRASLTLNQVSQADDGFTRFRIEGSGGVIKGLVDNTLEVFQSKLARWQQPKLKGHWFPDAFAGTMGELMAAIAENREPETSGRDNLNTVKAYLAGALSAREHRPVSPEEIGS